MPSPFPGMDPYLETPLLWQDVHHELISEIRAALNPALRPRYVARVELRVYVADQDDPGRDYRVPDVHVETAPNGGKRGRRSKNGAATALVEPLTVPLFAEQETKEARIEIRHIKSESLVAVIEVMSPSNKTRSSAGRASFMEKRQEVMNSPVHWVELDLLRTGLPSVTRPPLVPSDYRILISRGTDHLHAQYWPFSVRQPLPPLPVPLKGNDPDCVLDLVAVFRSVYERGAYDISVDYRKEPDLPLSRQDAKWADQLLRKRGLRK